MAQGNNAKREGARSNELYQLQALNRIVTAVGPLATEATLLSVLNAIIASDQDVEILLVRDTVTLEVFQQITNYETGVPVIEYKDVNGTVIPQPLPNPIEYLDPSAIMNLILTELLDQGLSLDAIQTSTGLSATEVTQLSVDTSASTLATPLTGLGMTVTTITNAAGNTSAGQRSISILNSGTVAASVAGQANNLPPGVEVTWEAGGIRDTLGILTWDATVNGGTTLIISTVG
jgi:hypothetical protein